MSKLILVIMLISSSVFADTSVVQDSVLLNTGDRAPFPGWLAPGGEDKLKDYELLTDSLNKSIDLYKANETLYTQKVTILTSQNDNLSKSVYDARNANDIEKFMYFALGVIATGLAVEAGMHLIK